MKSAFAVLALIAAIAFCGWSIFGDIPATQATPPAPDLSWLAWLIIGAVVLTVVFSIVFIIRRGGGGR